MTKSLRFEDDADFGRRSEEDFGMFEEDADFGMFEVDVDFGKVEEEEEDVDVGFGRCEDDTDFFRIEEGDDFGISFGSIIYSLFFLLRGKQ